MGHFSPWLKAAPPESPFPTSRQYNTCHRARETCMASRTQRRHPARWKAYRQSLVSSLATTVEQASFVASLRSVLTLLSIKSHLRHLKDVLRYMGMSLRPPYSIGQSEASVLLLHLEPTRRPLEVATFEWSCQVLRASALLKLQSRLLFGGERNACRPLILIPWAFLSHMDHTVASPGTFRINVLTYPTTVKSGWRLVIGTYTTALRTP